jgi:hypothetical protein
VILRLTLKTAQLVGESPAEWQALEKLVRLGEWTTGPRTDEDRLRQLVAELRRSNTHKLLTGANRVMSFVTSDSQIRQPTRRPRARALDRGAGTPSTRWPQAARRLRLTGRSWQSHYPLGGRGRPSSSCHACGGNPGCASFIRTSV